MLLYLIACDDCGAPRVGRKEGEGVSPIRDDCPVCGSSEYRVPSAEAD